MKITREMEEYKFFAFISYRHTDIREARKVQHFLENYHLPTSIRKNLKGEAPKKIKVFRDTDELTSGVLGEELRKKLLESKYLVVICSPSSAQSPYVGDEIEFFRSLGREDRIIPFIIDGVPHSADCDCFHPKLTEGGLELLGIDVQSEQGFCKRIKFNKACLRLVARMFDLNFGALWNRHKRYLIKKWTFLSLVGCALVAMLFAWLGARPFDARLKLDPGYNVDLPLSGDLSDSLWLCIGETDVHKRVITDLDSSLTFSNMPGSIKGSDVRIRCEIYGFVPLDTIVKMAPDITVRINRDPETYGRVRVIACDDATGVPMQGVNFDFGDGIAANTDADGLLDVLIPIERQRAKYPVSISLPISISLEGHTLHISGEDADSLMHYGNMSTPYTIYLK